jgi:hypothetical protein
MPWSLKAVRLRPDRQPAQKPAASEDTANQFARAQEIYVSITDSVSSKPYKGEVGERARQELMEVLQEGWEPFAVAPLGGVGADHMMWFRRFDPDTPSIAELPGHYL